MQVLINYKNEEEVKSVSINATNFRTYVSTDIDESKDRQLASFGEKLIELIQEYFQ